jgi:predicted Zn-dependent peptidase
MGMDRVMSQMMWTGESLLLSRKIMGMEEVIRRIHAVTREDIQRIANDIFVENQLKLAAVGPIPEQKEVVKWLKL